MTHPGIKCDVKISDSSLQDVIDTELFPDMTDDQFEEQSRVSKGSQEFMMKNVDAEAEVLPRNSISLGDEEVLDNLSDQFQTYADTQLFGSDMYIEGLPESSIPLRTSKPDDGMMHVHDDVLDIVADHTQSLADTSLFVPDNYADELPGPSNRLHASKSEDAISPGHEDVLDGLVDDFRSFIDASVIDFDMFADESPGPSNRLPQDLDLPEIDLRDQIQTEELPGPSNRLHASKPEDGILPLHEDVSDGLGDHFLSFIDTSLIDLDMYVNNLPGPSKLPQNLNVPAIDKLPDVLCDQIQGEDLPGPSNLLRASKPEDAILPLHEDVSYGLGDNFPSFIDAPLIDLDMYVTDLPGPSNRLPQDLNLPAIDKLPDVLCDQIQGEDLPGPSNLLRASKPDDEILPGHEDVSYGLGDNFPSFIDAPLIDLDMYVTDLPGPSNRLPQDLNLPAIDKLPDVLCDQIQGEDLPGPSNRLRASKPDDEILPGHEDVSDGLGDHFSSFIDAPLIDLDIYVNDLPGPSKPPQNRNLPEIDLRDQIQAEELPGPSNRLRASKPDDEILPGHEDVSDGLGDHFSSFIDAPLIDLDIYVNDLPGPSKPPQNRNLPEIDLRDQIQAEELPGPSNRLRASKPEDEILPGHEDVSDGSGDQFRSFIDASLINLDMYADDLPGPSNRPPQNRNFPEIDLRDQIQGEDLPGPSKQLRKSKFEDIKMSKELTVNRQRWEKKNVKIKTMDGEFSVTTWAPNPADDEEGSDSGADSDYTHNVTDAPHVKETNTESTYLNDRKVVCSYRGCRKILKDKTSLRKHRLIHGPRAHICVECDKAFVDNAKLKRHQLVHTGEQPYQCTFQGCKARFSLDFNLRTHLRTHTGEKPYVCLIDGCNHRFAQSSNLKSHIQSMHGKKIKRNPRNQNRK